MPHTHYSLTSPAHLRRGATMCPRKDSGGDCMTVTDVGSQRSAAPAGGPFPGLAASTLITTGLLILVGGVVRVSGHGLGCPDWPLCYGRAIPPGLTGAWVEFTHRLVSMAAGAQIVLLGVLAWRRHRGEKWIWRAAPAASAPPAGARL